MTGKVSEQLPRRQYAGGIDAEQALDCADAGQWRQARQPGPGPGATDHAGEDDVTLRRIKRRQIEALIGLDPGELDALEQRVEDQPPATLGKRGEAVAKARLQEPQPGAIGAVGEDHDSAPLGTCRAAAQATIPFLASASPSRSSPSRQWRTSSPRPGR